MVNIILNVLKALSEHNTKVKLYFNKIKRSRIVFDKISTYYFKYKLAKFHGKMNA